jgi:hypothetical protein
MFGQLWVVDPPELPGDGVPCAGALGAGDGLAVSTGAATRNATTAATASSAGSASSFSQRFSISFHLLFTGCIHSFGNEAQIRLRAGCDFGPESAQTWTRRRVVPAVMPEHELRRERQEVLRIIDRLLESIADSDKRKELAELRMAIMRSTHPWSELLAG